MAHVANDAAQTTPRPCMDRLTHAILKETSKSLKYYMDVRCRENAFVLNTHASVGDTRLLKTKLIAGANKDHPSSHRDNDPKSSSSSFQHKQKPLHATLPSPEKQMCREELNFHMHSYRFFATDNSKSSDVHWRPKRRSSSLNVTKRDLQSRSGFQLTRYEKDHLIDNTADILASMVKSRQSLFGTGQLAQQTSPIPGPPSEVQSNVADLKTSQVKSENGSGRDFLPRVTSMTQKGRPISKRIMCEYRVSVTTGNCNGASTSAPVRMKLYGTNGHSTFHDLVHSETHYVPFLKDQTDRFLLRTPHVGVLAGITIGHDRKDMKASWFLSKVSVDDPVRKVVYDISCNGWLSIKSNDQKTMRDFPVIATRPYEKNNSSNEYEEEIESQSGYSTLSTNGTMISGKSTLSQTNSIIGLRPGRKLSKQRRVSIGPTSIAEIPALIGTGQTKISSTTTAETYKKQDASPASLTTPAYRPHSTTSSNTEVDNDSRHSMRLTAAPAALSGTRLKSLSEQDVLDIASTSDMFQQCSIDSDRPPTHLEQQTSPISIPSKPAQHSAVAEV